jgi:hypothetical protein
LRKLHYIFFTPEYSWDTAKKSFKTPKGWSEIVNRRTDNAQKRTNNDIQNISHKTTDQATRTTLTLGGRLKCSGSSCSTCGTHRVTLATKLGTSHKWTILWLRRTEHICGHLWHRFSVTVISVHCSTIKLSKWRLQLNH